MAGGAPHTATGSALTSYVMGKSAHVMYLDDGGNVRELWWNASGWHRGR